MKNKSLIYSLLIAGLCLLFLSNCQNGIPERPTNNGIDTTNVMNELYLFNFEYKTNIRLTHSPDVKESRYAFSADNKYIMFFTPDGGYTLNSFSYSTLMQWTTKYPTYVDYSPNRNEIVYMLNKNLFLMNTDGSNDRQLTTDDLSYAFPAWSPDGQKIACNYKNGTGIVSIPDGTLVNLTNQRSNDGFVWSLNSDKIFYTRNDNKYFSQVFSFDLPQKRETQLTNGDKFNSSPNINPVNGKVVFTSSLASSGSDLIIMNPDGTQQTSIYHGSSISTPKWSPDGNQITFINGQIGSNSELALINSNGENFRIISTSKGGYRQPVWSPDGKCILYIRQIY